MKCRSCGASGKTQSIRAPIVFGDSLGAKKFFECSICNLIYMMPPLDQDEEANFYAKEFEKYMELRSADDVDWSGPEGHVASNQGNVERRWRAMEKYCEKGQNILEVGCSSGFMLKKFIDEGMNAIGIEPSGGFSQYLTEKKYKIFSDIYDLPEGYNNFFDVICHFFVLEHISDTKKFISKKLDLLKPGGLIFCEVPSATDPLTTIYNIAEFEEFYWSIAHHYYFTPSSISYILSEMDIANFKIIPEQRYDLSNHITWLGEGIPGGQGKFDCTFSSELNARYKSDLISKGFFDTFFLVIKKD